MRILSVSFLVRSIKYRKLKYVRSKNIVQIQSWAKLKKLFKVGWESLCLHRKPAVPVFYKTSLHAGDGSGSTLV